MNNVNDKSKSPLVSVLMTAYNREDFIVDAIESVLASTFKDFELIIVDDCSKDSTVSIAEKYCALDQRVFLHVNPQNLGDYNNRNKAASYARGKYLKYLDSDDILEPDGLETLVLAMEKYPSAAIGMMWIYDNETTEPVLYSSKDALKEYFINNRFLMVGPSGSIYNRKIFFEMGGFSGLNFIGDFEFNMKCALKYPIVRVKNGILFYRVHEGNQSSNPGHSKTYRRYLYKIQNSILADKNCSLDQQDIAIGLRKIRKMQARRIFLYLFSSGNFSEVIKLIKETMGWKRFLLGLFIIK